MTAVAVCADMPEPHPRARDLSARLDLPLTDCASQDFKYLLCVSSQRLELRTPGARAPGPVYVDFVHGALAYRGRQPAAQDLLARALGRKSVRGLNVVDATAGLGRDAFVIAGLGCRVRLIERSAIIAALLADGLERAAMEPRVAERIERMALIEADAIAWLRDPGEQRHPDVIYLDPMYPERRKSARVKKEMRVFQDLVGKDEDADRLLAAALLCARRRVVVKRPRLAPPLPGAKPDSAVIGNTTRYDIYACL